MPKNNSGPLPRIKLVDWWGGGVFRWTVAVNPHLTYRPEIFDAAMQYAYERNRKEGRAS